MEKETNKKPKNGASKRKSLSLTLTLERDIVSLKTGLAVIGEIVIKNESRDPHYYFSEDTVLERVNFKFFNEDGNILSTLPYGRLFDSAFGEYKEQVIKPGEIIKLSVVPSDVFEKGDLKLGKYKIQAILECFDIEVKSNEVYVTIVP